MNRFGRVKQILDDSVNGQNFGAHGAFWRGQTRDQFVSHTVFGFPLLVVGDGAGSNLVKALKGETPFGQDTGTAGAVFRRMPGGRPPVSGADIDFIQQWIGDGAPEDAPQAVVTFDFSAGGAGSEPQIHVDFWRDFDNWAMFQVTPEIRHDIDMVMQAAPKWMAFAKDPAQEQTWENEIGASMVLDPIMRLAELQTNTLVRHYGDPVPMKTVMDSYERFGDDSLPDDPLRPADPRHNMNGPTMWFFWSAFCDACVRTFANPDIRPFGRALARVAVLGLMNDGLFRGRFNVTGFTSDPAGTEAMRTHVLSLADDQLQAELVKRFVESGF